jgi:hypothetical protein
MATAEKSIKRVPMTVYEETTEIVVRLSSQEAAALYILTGALRGERGQTGKLYNRLKELIKDPSNAPRCVDFFYQSPLWAEGKEIPDNLF